MTHQSADEPVPAEESAQPRPAPDALALGGLLEEACRQAARFLTEASRAPRAIRIRVGEVSFDAEWADSDGPDAAASASPPPVNGAATQRGAPEAGSVAAPEAVVVSPSVGVYYEAPEPAADPFVREGDLVRAGAQVAIVEVMKLMVPVVAEREGRIAEVLKKNGDSVEYGEQLFVLEPGAGDD
ncbi:acetyl-CoA carboxylase biotin carboxyl carrier protein [Streptomonospora wellingtoniae]|uniref:Biotin carboxyl carrier protein of acetyl-CoA carboxylase n=1 Tax=Streptomonospora wellingtoniae TaxID=3075544 RepID=A0ABU2KXA5_9ACTN|nr:biotin/lipoyl-containing protein [Streptomonospora sp. DSM 45055]MDT0303932.1 biotin/lipoyl-containing protein [Streptomonospora sp. DSM 45055]